MTAIDEAAREIPPDIAAEILRLKSEAAAMPVPPYDPLKQAHACLCAIRHVAKDIEQARKFADTGIAEAQQAVDARRHLAPPGERELEPQWMERPSCPGLWVCEPKPGCAIKHPQALRLSQFDLDRGAPHLTARVLAMAKVNVWEVLRWTCPNCFRDNDEQSYLERGDKVVCVSCGSKHTVAEHYADCRPSSKPRPKAKGT
jgi:hypothetical protein